MHSPLTIEFVHSDKKLKMTIPTVEPKHVN